jgi:hypothetical protein
MPPVALPHARVLHLDGLEVYSRPGETERRARLTAPRPANAVLASFAGSTPETRPTRYTVQVGRDAHIELRPEALKFISHSCDPNVRFDVTRRLLVTLRPMAAGEELAFFYPSTEWSMAEPFDCWCGTARCLGRIAGAAHLPREVLAGYVLEPHILELLAAVRAA